MRPELCPGEEKLRHPFANSSTSVNLSFTRHRTLPPLPVASPDLEVEAKLPVELILLLANFLEPKDLVNLTHCCTLWRRELYNTSNLWKTLEVHNNQFQYDYALLNFTKLWIDRSRGKLLNLKISSIAAEISEWKGLKIPRTVVGATLNAFVETGDMGLETLSVTLPISVGGRFLRLTDEQLAVVTSVDSVDIETLIRMFKNPTMKNLKSIEIELHCRPNFSKSVNCF